MPYLTQSSIHHYDSGTPIYYIVAQRAVTGIGSNYGVMTILEVIEMYLEDLTNNTILVQEVSNRINQHQAAGRYINTSIFSREPANPFSRFNTKNSTHGNVSHGQITNDGGISTSTTDPSSYSKNTGQQKSVDDEIQEAIENADYTSSDAW